MQWMVLIHQFIKSPPGHSLRAVLRTGYFGKGALLFFIYIFLWEHGSHQQVGKEFQAEIDVFLENADIGHYALKRTIHLDSAANGFDRFSNLKRGTILCSFIEKTASHDGQTGFRFRIVTSACEDSRTEGNRWDGR